MSPTNCMKARCSALRTEPIDWTGKKKTHLYMSLACCVDIRGGALRPLVVPPEKSHLRSWSLSQKVDRNSRIYKTKSKKAKQTNRSASCREGLWLSVERHLCRGVKGARTNPLGGTCRMSRAHFRRLFPLPTARRIEKILRIFVMSGKTHEETKVHACI